MCFSCEIFSSQAQLQQQLSPNEYAQMQERENAIVQLEVGSQKGQVQLAQAPTDPLQAQQTQELEQLERDIQDMAETFTEVHKLVHDQGEQIGKPSTGWPNNLTDDLILTPSFILTEKFILPCFGQDQNIWDYLTSVIQ